MELLPLCFEPKGNFIQRGNDGFSAGFPEIVSNVFRTVEGEGDWGFFYSFHSDFFCCHGDIIKKLLPWKPTRLAVVALEIDMFAVAEWSVVGGNAESAV